MRLVINTAIGGHFLPPPDETTVWPQDSRGLGPRLRAGRGAGDRKFPNGGFEEDGGTLAGWHMFGNRIDGEPNVLVHREAVRDGTTR